MRRCYVNRLTLKAVRIRIACWYSGPAQDAGVGARADCGLHDGLRVVASLWPTRLVLAPHKTFIHRNGNFDSTTSFKAVTIVLVLVQDEQNIFLLVLMCKIFFC